jgi:AcrR family transcriptional regulator
VIAVASSRVRIRAAQAERSRVTRGRILSAATDLIAGEGYLHTTMAGIAAEAGVAVQTLYLTFGSKAAILAAALDVAIVGDDEPLPLLERPWLAELVAEPDGHRAVQIFVDTASTVIERHYPLYAAIRAAAADPEVADLLARNKRQRFVTHSTVAAALADKRGYDGELAVQRAAQIIYTLMSQETYGLLVVELGWAMTEWARWVRRQIAAELFPPRLAPGRPR